MAFGSSDDITMAYDGTDNELDILQNVAGTGKVAFGTDDTGMDVTFYGATSGKYLIWDESADEAIFVDATALCFGSSSDVDFQFDGTGKTLDISFSSTDQSIHILSTAAQTTASLLLDAASNNANLADNVGLLTLSSDNAYAHAGATSLLVTHATGQPISAAEGFLARFVSTGTARTNAYAVEIEVPATQPALNINGITAITGQDNPGAYLVQITSNDATGNKGALDVHGEGTDPAVRITSDDADTPTLSLLAATNQTVASLLVDGDTSGWGGADGVGQVHIQNDIAGLHANTSMLLIDKSAAIAEINSAAGSCLRIVENMNAAGATAYAAYISSTNNEALHVDAGLVLVDELVEMQGLQYTATARTATADGSGTGTIADATSFVALADNDDANKIIILPTPTPGKIVWITPEDTGYELRSSTPASVAINGGTGAAAESAVGANVAVRCVCMTATTWICSTFAADGTEAKLEAAA
jgi:hypothetical protein